MHRGIIFLDLAVAQIAGLGVIIAYSFGWEAGGWQIQFVAVSAALTGAIFLYWADRLWPDIQEAIIGSVFILAASASILALSSNPHGGEQLKELLAGQILWVSYAQLTPISLLSVAVLATWFGLRRKQYPLMFYALFALAVTSSVQLVGVYLVFASLIIPALAVRLRTRGGYFLAYFTGAAGYALGLVLSALMDWPSGATIVWCLAICAVAIARFPRHEPSSN